MVDNIFSAGCIPQKLIHIPPAIYRKHIFMRLQKWNIKVTFMFNLYHQIVDYEKNFSALLDNGHWRFLQ